MSNHLDTHTALHCTQTLQYSTVYNTMIERGWAWEGVFPSHVQNLFSKYVKMLNLVLSGALFVFLKVATWAMFTSPINWTFEMAFVGGKTY